MSLYNLWRFRIGFAAMLALYGAGAIAMAIWGGWRTGIAAFVAGVAGACAIALLPWTHGQRPQAPHELPPV